MPCQLMCSVVFAGLTGAIRFLEDLGVGRCLAVECFRFATCCFLLMCHFLSGSGFSAARASEPLPVGETGCASGVGAFAGNRLQGLRPLGRRTEAGRKALRSALRAEP